MAAIPTNPFWERPGKGERMEEDHTPAVDYLLKELQLKSGSCVLEVGCGIGWLLRKLAPEISYGLGTDRSSELIEKARELSRNHKNLEFRVDELDNLSDQSTYRSESFDNVIGVESVYWTPVQRNLKQFYRILRPGGKLGLTVEAYKENEEAIGWSKEVGRQLHLHSVREYQEMLRQAGFKDIESYKFIVPQERATESFQHKYGTLILTAVKQFIIL